MSDPKNVAPAIAALEERAAEATAFLKKLANQDRLMIVCTLIQGERSVRELEESLGLRQPSLSQQLGELRQAGMIEGRKEGREMFYRLADERVCALVGTLYQIFCK